MTTEDLTGQVAFVTGAGRPHGIGRSIALELAARGADVAVNDVQPTGVQSRGETSTNRGDSAFGLAALQAEIESLGRRGIVVLGDVSVASDVDRMIGEVLQAFGKVDILVNNAAAARGDDRVPVVELDEGNWHRVVEANLTGTFLCTRAVLRHMLSRPGGGRVINLSSTSGKVGDANEAAYCATKFGIIGFTQAVSREVAGTGITVNAVCPGLIETDRVRGRIQEEYPSESLLDATVLRVARTVPVGRIGTPGDVAHLVAFLAATTSDFITGQAYNVCGGEVMH